MVRRSLVRRGDAPPEWPQANGTFRDQGFLPTFCQTLDDPQRKRDLVPVLDENGFLWANSVVTFNGPTGIADAFLLLVVCNRGRIDLRGENKIVLAQPTDAMRPEG